MKQGHDRLQRVEVNRRACVMAQLVYASAMEAAFLNWAAGENYRSIKHGGEAVSDDCDNCMSDLALASRGYCVACGYRS